MGRTLKGMAAASAIAASLAMAEEPGERFTNPLGVPLGRASIDEIQTRFGKAPIAVVGHQMQVLCYVWPEHQALITFTAQAEGLSGGFTMRRMTQAAPEECPVITAAVAARLTLSVGGLELGMRNRQFASAIGRSGPLPGGLVGATFKRAEPIAPQQPAGPDAGKSRTVEIVVGGRFTGGRLTELVIWKSISM
jgi:hypothetical protein